MLVLQVEREAERGTTQGTGVRQAGAQASGRRSVGAQCGACLASAVQHPAYMVASLLPAAGCSCNHAVDQAQIHGLLGAEEVVAVCREQGMVREFDKRTGVEQEDWAGSARGW